MGVCDHNAAATSALCAYKFPRSPETTLIQEEEATALLGQLGSGVRAAPIALILLLSRGAC